MNDETTPYAPAVAKAALTAPTRTAAARSCYNLLVAAGVAATVACSHVKTGAKAGDCFFTPVHKASGKRIPETLPVIFDPSTPGGMCTGKRHPSRMVEEPCPAYEGPVVLTLAAPIDQPDELWQFYGPPPEYDTPQLLGQMTIIPGMGIWEDPGHKPALRKTIGRATALITKMRMQDGTTWPVCGVLFADDQLEGVAILAPEYYGKATGATWGAAYVRFYWPERPEEP